MEDDVDDDGGIYSLTTDVGADWMPEFFMTDDDGLVNKVFTDRFVCDSATNTALR